MAGALYLVATPIGNLEDITLRALRVLREVDLVACEDTRHTRKLLAHYNISKQTVSYHEHNERERAIELAEKLQSGTSIALVSDAGTPAISDPGFRLVREAIDRRIPVIPIPGPSAFVAALAASGLPTSDFIFAGFLPARRGPRRSRLADFADSRSTLIFYEAPHRIKQAVEDALAVLGDRPCVIARELTKLHEEIARSTLAEIAGAVAEREARGEFVLLIGPPLQDNQARPVSESILEEVEAVMRAEGLDQKSAIKRVARSRGIGKSEAYRILMSERAAADRGK